MCPIDQLTRTRIGSNKYIHVSTIVTRVVAAVLLFHRRVKTSDLNELLGFDSFYQFLQINLSKVLRIVKFTVSFTKCSFPTR